MLDTWLSDSAHLITVTDQSACSESRFQSDIKAMLDQWSASAVSTDASEGLVLQLASLAHRRVLQRAIHEDYVHICSQYSVKHIYS